MISLTALLYADVFGAVTLAGWTIGRFPRQRPTSVVTALAIAVAAMLVAQVSLRFIPVLMGLKEGLYVVLIGCVLPIFFCLFLTTGWLLLAILGLHDEPSGGDGVRLDEGAQSRA